MKKRYAHFIRPLLVLADIFIINTVFYGIADDEYINGTFLVYSTLFWVISSFFTGFYKVYRFTKKYRISTLLITQFSLFILGYFTYFGLFREGVVVNNQAIVLGTILIGITGFKFLSFALLKKNRAGGNNYRTVIFIGVDASVKKLMQLFYTQRDLGYQVLGFFSNKESQQATALGTIHESMDFALQNNIDELYCSVGKLSPKQIKDLTKFANQHNKTIKLIPDAGELYSKNQQVEFYNHTLKVLSIKKMPFEFAENHFIKRTFDLVFSLFVSVFFLSWLAPIIWLAIKLESKGPALFKQEREGLDGVHFVCYKFRSMKITNILDNIHAKKNDERVTRVGAFLRKTSMDELPQFLNVLQGTMSVVGPRPHIKSLSQEYQKDVENYMDRHAVKPGITGLAQVSGCRGEIKKKADIKNRIRFDIFYIENWSFFLDVKIIFQTIFNVFTGEEKAY